MRKAGHWARDWDSHCDTLSLVLLSCWGLGLEVVRAGGWDSHCDTHLLSRSVVGPEQVVLDLSCVVPLFEALRLLGLHSLLCCTNRVTLSSPPNCFLNQLQAKSRGAATGRCGASGEGSRDFPPAPPQHILFNFARDRSQLPVSSVCVSSSTSSYPAEGKLLGGRRRQ